EEEIILQSMTLDQKIGQLFLVRPETLAPDQGPITSVTDAVREGLKEKMPGGVILFGDNITGPKQVKAFNADLKEASLEYFSLPMFISTDEEGGRVARIGGNPNFDVKRYGSMLEIGNTGDTANAKAVGKTIGGYLKKYGFNLDFAPVADCFTNPANQVIGDRSFGSDPKNVAKMVRACIKGFHSKGIMTSIKHFPGHGDTSSDTHTGTVITYSSWDELKARELVPFIKNFEKTDMIMVSHIVCKGVRDDIAPATLSKTMITEKLRGELGYDGVVITDAMEMGAIANVYTPADSTVRAIKAGCDIILCPADFNAAKQGILDAIEAGEITEERIDESVLRILRLKLKYS
ncbi:MAG: glycoside hydrolase family 3 protein, partial [Firmicutes bacterium]|nr:glycoside hydrolase family 3 protein [Bacillota bacterium]